MKQHRIICIPTLTFALLLMFTPSILQAQDKPVFPIDSLITVGYATGNKKQRIAHWNAVKASFTLAS